MGIYIAAIAFVNIIGAIIGSWLYAKQKLYKAYVVQIVNGVLILILNML